MYRITLMNTASKIAFTLNLGTSRTYYIFVILRKK